MSNPSLQLWQHAERLLAQRDVASAGEAYQRLARDPDWRLPAHLRLASLALAAGRLREGVEHSLAAFAVREPDPVLLEALCRQLIAAGELEAAVACADDPAIAACDDPAVLVGIARLMGEQSMPQRALALLRRARGLGQDGADERYLCGNFGAYAGEVDVAEADLEACLSMRPDHAPAHRVLSKLRRQSPAANHIDRLRAALARMPDGHRDAPLLHYALFKELDDVGDVDEAWAALATGMALRRSQVQYDEGAEVAMFEHLSLLEPRIDGDNDNADDGPQPIFIVGMPRSGTTLLERILGAHDDVADAGELRDLTFQLRWATGRMGGPHPDLALMQAAEQADWRLLGTRYLGHTRWHSGGCRFYTDKLPPNFLHVANIARALPRARILHMVRGPMDVCFSNLKELFAEAYPHSYEQGEMARHLLRYRRLMAHWHSVLPGRVLDVDYARLVTAPETVAREVLAFCGLPWQDGVEAIESRTGVVATASAVQVRQPIHTRFLGQWQRYAARLAPLREVLGSAGDVD